MARRVLFISSLALSLVASSQVPDDPVMRVRNQRAAAQGIAEGDLPALPRGIVEPPPLPPPEAHVKDVRKARRAQAKKGKVRTGKAKARTSTKAPSSARKHK
jgi:hypothetical protein